MARRAELEVERGVKCDSSGAVIPPAEVIKGQPGRSKEGGRKTTQSANLLICKRSPSRRDAH